MRTPALLVMTCIGLAGGRASAQSEPPTADLNAWRGPSYSALNYAADRRDRTYATLPIAWASSYVPSTVASVARSIGLLDDTNHPNPLQFWEGPHDGPQPMGWPAGQCPAGYALVALAVRERIDCHWHRLNADGTWSHKPGQAQATMKDANGADLNASNPPHLAALQPYTFTKYMCVPGPTLAWGARASTTWTETNALRVWHLQKNAMEDLVLNDFLDPAPVLNRLPPASAVTTDPGWNMLPQLEHKGFGVLRFNGAPPAMPVYLRAYRGVVAYHSDLSGGASSTITYYNDVNGLESYLANGFAHGTGSGFEIYPGCITFVSRGSLGLSAGDVLVEVPGTHFAGVGQDASGTGTELRGFQYAAQDQLASTPETYGLLVRRVAASAPDCSPAGVLMSAGPFSLPPSTVTGGMGWLITTSLATPSNALPPCGTFYFGVALTAAPGFPGDGQTVHIANYDLNSGLRGENAAAGAPDLGWSCVAGAAVQAPAKRTIRFGLLVDHPVLNTGNVDPTVDSFVCVSAQGNRSWGAGGLWPACNAARRDGLDVRVRHARHAGGPFVVFVGAEIGCPGVPLPGLASGALFLSPIGLTQVAAGFLNSEGAGASTVLPPGSPVCGGIVNQLVALQGLTIAPTLTLPGSLTNRCNVLYLP